MNVITGSRTKALSGLSAPPDQTADHPVSSAKEAVCRVFLPLPARPALWCTWVCVLLRLRCHRCHRCRWLLNPSPPPGKWPVFDPGLVICGSYGHLPRGCCALGLLALAFLGAIMGPGLRGSSGANLGCEAVHGGRWRCRRGMWWRRMGHFRQRGSRGSGGGGLVGKVRQRCWRRRRWRRMGQVGWLGVGSIRWGWAMRVWSMSSII